MMNTIKHIIKPFRKKYHFQIEVTNACNLRCTACPWHTTMTRDIHNMTIEEWNTILKK